MEILYGQQQCRRCDLLALEGPSLLGSLLDMSASLGHYKHSPPEDKLGEIIGLFKEFTVHCGIHLIINWVKTPISFLSNTITHKDTFNNSRFKFVSVSFEKMNIDNTSKNTRR